MPATAPSTRNVAVDCGAFVEKTSRAEALGQDLRTARVHEEHGVPVPEEAHRRGGVLGQQRSTRQVDELLAVVVAERSQAHPLGDGEKGGSRHAGPGGRVTES